MVVKAPTHGLLGEAFSFNVEASTTLAARTDADGREGPAHRPPGDMVARSPMDWATVRGMVVLGRLRLVSGWDVGKCARSIMDGLPKISTPEVVLPQKMKLTEGRLTVNVDTAPAKKNAATVTHEYKIEVEVTDSSRRTLSETQRDGRPPALRGAPVAGSWLWRVGKP